MSVWRPFVMGNLLVPAAESINAINALMMTLVVMDNARNSARQNGNNISIATRVATVVLYDKESITVEWHFVHMIPKIRMEIFPIITKPNKTRNISLSMNNLSANHYAPQSRWAGAEIVHIEAITGFHFWHKGRLLRHPAAKHDVLLKSPTDDFSIDGT